ncbi:MAG: hypothetical protein ABEJ81_01240 [Haloferacaceae archaeon]
MTTATQYLAFALGCVLLVGGAYQAFGRLGSITPVLVWSCVGIGGMFPLVYGFSAISAGRTGAGERGQRGRPARRHVG